MQVPYLARDPFIGYFMQSASTLFRPLPTPTPPPLPLPIPSPSRPLYIRNRHHLHTVPAIQSSSKKFQQQLRPFVFVLAVESQGADENKCWIESVLTDVV